MNSFGSKPHQHSLKQHSKHCNIVCELLSQRKSISWFFNFKRFINCHLFTIFKKSKSQPKYINSSMLRLCDSEIRKNSMNPGCTLRSIKRWISCSWKWHQDVACINVSVWKPMRMKATERISNLRWYPRKITPWPLCFFITQNLSHFESLWRLIKYFIQIGGFSVLSDQIILITIFDVSISSEDVRVLNKANLLQDLSIQKV